ncbi:histidine phosphatase family protein [Cronobacter turicensis]|nr:histidine phosphatase family protein [Cronobacter turicensis]ELQ6077489.1 histidine phosphatase family protein [Cronobacter turicensis]ELQ6184960.1 histidine phosphatase family protein [Cronobacter turicensis]ELQ6235176.1 histidine phosphatase family protein [Cronobacter turicensis]ELQ6239348.1 histidine phosphatase family protein [Cronobacter turicensis]
MNLLLIRHAETEWNRGGLIQGRQDSALTARGVRETTALITALAYDFPSVDMVYTSPAGRARQMGNAIASHFRCPLSVESLLQEQAFGDYEGLSRVQLQRDEPARAEALFSTDAAFTPPGGESLACAAQRLLSFIQNGLAATSHTTCCVVTHGHILQGALAILKDGKMDNFPRYAQPNASYTRLSVASGRCEVIQWGIATHLRHLSQT